MGSLAALFFLIGILVALIGTGTALVGLGVLMVVGALLFGLSAPVPVIWAWLRNRSLHAQEEREPA
jgi:Zn-dependent membrane protease YugP